MDIKTKWQIYYEKIKEDPERLKEYRAQVAKRSKKKRLKKKDNPEWLKKHIAKNPDRYRMRKLLYSYKRNDLFNKRDNDLDLPWMLENILGKNCHYCGAKGRVGVDRKDSKFGHLKSQCVPACPSCNSLKGNRFSYDEMVIIGEQLKKVSPELRKRAYQNAREYAKYMARMMRQGIFTTIDGLVLDK